MTRPTSRRALAGGSFLALGALVLAGCAGGFDEPTGGSASGSAQTSITAALPTDPTSMDPIRSGALVVLSVFFHTHDQLVKITADGEMVPKLATDWSANADLTEWEFTLQPDVTASNGEEITADDVVFSYETILGDPTGENYAYLSSVDRVEKVDDLTVRFVLKQPFSAFPRNTSLISIVPADTYQEMGADAYAREPIGSGPYVFDRITAGVSYDLVRNDDYWGEAPAIETISLQPVSSAESRASGVLSGDLDVAQIGPTQVSSIESAGNAQVFSALSNGVVFLGANSTAGPLQDVRVREAIGHAIDTEAIVDSLLAGLAEPAKAMLAPAVEGYSDYVEAIGYDPETARALLAEAGYDGTPIPFDYATDGRIPLSSEVAQSIQGYLEAVGIAVDMRGADQQSHTLKVRGKEMQGIYLNTWAPSTLDGDLPLTDFYEPAGNNNYALDPTTTQLAERQRGVEGAEREDVFAELLGYSNEQVYFVPLYVPANNFAAGSSLQWTPRADGLYDFTETSFE
ncbi:ABC transporter substrate-binding protein [Microbacterium sp. cf332]|uniref:ABC transporter substrate-binding protein n=1 Tax=Microbacterium sp. cf332 TaxID=1761804 RepID=UPI0008848B6D|nr:ABC transporter substrate-binding protein [Microbacterium sp. cf332]SDQ67323.1 peptide/nickel transport system substrate-binding protein [Microbacterium sp. cf332]